MPHFPRFEVRRTEQLISSHRYANLWETQAGVSTCCLSKCGPMSNRISEMQNSPSLRPKPKLPVTSQNIIFLRQWQIILQQKILPCQIKRKKELWRFQIKWYNTTQRTFWIGKVSEPIFCSCSLILYCEKLFRSCKTGHTNFHVTHRVRKEVFSDSYKHHCHLSVDALS